MKYTNNRWWSSGSPIPETSSPEPVVGARPAGEGPLAALAETLYAEQVELPGVTGAVPEVDAFAEAWQERSGLRCRPRMTQRIYRLTEVRPIGGVAGRPRAATEADRGLLVSWVRAFAEKP